MAKDSHLKVLDGGNAGTVCPGTETWAEGVRENAKSLAGSLDEGYMELARLLWAIYDTPIDGDSKNGPIYTKWGYAAFGDYVEQELGIHKKKAQRLRSVWYNLEIRLGTSLDPELKQRVVALGFSKVRELVSVLSAKNAEAWVSKAEELSYPKLCVSIRKYKEDREAYQAGKDGSAEGEGTIFEEGINEGGGGSGDGEPAAVDSVLGQPLEYEPPVPDYESSDLTQEHFSFYPEQHDIVKQAISTAQKLSNSSVKSNNLHLICLDYLATNGDGKGTKQQKMKRLVQIAKIYGFDLVIVDDGDVAFGLETLENMAKNS